MDTIKLNHKYRVKKPYKYDDTVLHYHADQGEILIFTGKSLGYAHFITDIGSKNPRTVIMKGKEAFKHLEEAE